MTNLLRRLFAPKFDTPVAFQKGLEIELVSAGECVIITYFGCLET